jgi:hypothetical protein
MDRRESEGALVRVTPPGFDHRMDVLPGVYTPGYSMPRLRRYKPSPPLALQTKSASGVTNHVRLRQLESYCACAV